MLLYHLVFKTPFSQKCDKLFSKIVREIRSHGTCFKFLFAVFDFERLTYFRPLIFASQASTMLDNIHTYEISTKSHARVSESSEKRRLKSRFWFWPGLKYLLVTLSNFVTLSSELKVYKIDRMKLSECWFQIRKPHQNRMMRTSAHCVHVLTLLIENLMAVRRRTFYMRANELGAVSVDDFFAKSLLTLKKSI